MGGIVDPDQNLPFGVTAAMMLEHIKHKDKQVEHQIDTLNARISALESQHRDPGVVEMKNLRRKADAHDEALELLSGTSAATKPLKWYILLRLRSWAAAENRLAALWADAQRARWCEKMKADVTRSEFRGEWVVRWRRTDADHDVRSDGLCSVSHPDRNTAIDMAMQGGK